MTAKTTTTATGPGLDLLVSFDTTGSMYPCLTQVRRDVEQTVRRLYRDIPGLRIAVKAHGDYCDARTSYVTKTLDFTVDLESVCRFIRGVGETGGGDSPECYELVLHEARSLAWRAGNLKAFVLIGDDVPHEKSYPQNTKKIDWKNELDLLTEADIKVYGVHAMPGIRRHSKPFYQEVARKTGGYYLTLDQFAAITDVIMAVCYKNGVNHQLVAFQEEVREEGRMTRNMAQVFTELTGTRVSVPVKPGLTPVPAGRFQVIPVDRGLDRDDLKISSFVKAQGLPFKKGRGFYQFTKPELVQEAKEVVLRDKATGDMYSGDEARELIGVPAGTRGKVKPKALDEYDVFIQSTSFNRQLVAGTQFLYEVVDG